MSNYQTGRTCRWSRNRFVFENKQNMCTKRTAARCRARPLHGRSDRRDGRYRDDGRLTRSTFWFRDRSQDILNPYGKREKPQVPPFPRGGGQWRRGIRNRPSRSSAIARGNAAETYTYCARCVCTGATRVACVYIIQYTVWRNGARARCFSCTFIVPARL